MKMACNLQLGLCLFGKKNYFIVLKKLIKDEFS